MLKITGVQKTFNPGTINEKKALCGIDLTLNEGDFVTVIGGNGAGKSTMLNMIAGVYPVDCGSIVIDGQDVTKLPEYKRAKFIGRVARLRICRLPRIWPSPLAVARGEPCVPALVKKKRLSMQRCSRSWIWGWIPA